MEAREAIAAAKTLLKDLYADEAVSEIRLEEVEFDDPSDSWRITLGLMRPAVRSYSSHLLASADASSGSVPLKRTYKVVTVPDSGIQRPSVKIRELTLDE